VFEPSVPPPIPPPRFSSEPASTEGRGLRLLDDVRAAQRRALQAQGVLFGLSAALALGLSGLLMAAFGWPRLGQAVFLLAPMVGFGLFAFFAFWLATRRVGNAERTARLLATQLPELNLDLLAAVELSKALGKPDDFSPDLARAFLREVDARAARHPVHTLINPRPVRLAGALFATVVLATLATLAWQGALVRQGFAVAFASADEHLALRRSPITGDFELTYHYPAHTGLEARTVAGTGDVNAPAGTEVMVKTRADREVDGAALIVNGTRAPMVVTGRELNAKFVLETSGQYHVAFLSGSRITAEGPDLSITVEADLAPQVRITSPIDNLELDPAKQSVTLKFDASDDYGLTALDLVFRPAGGAEQRVSLKPDDGRTTRGTFQWDIASLKLHAGQSVSYYLEATDNDAVKGPKKGVSSTLHLKLYSAEEHRREALKKAEALWERLITHVADRLEGADRVSPATVEAALAGKPVDARVRELSDDLTQLAHDLDEDRDPPEELIQALRNVGTEVARDASTVSVHRRVMLRLAGKDGSFLGEPAPPTRVAEAGKRLAASIALDATHGQKNVLYLEALLDRQKLEAIKALAKELKEDRRELSSLLEQYAKTKDPQLQQALLEQMGQLKARMMELQQRMAELAKGIRDDFMNADAMQQMLEDENMGSSLDEVEKLIREGKAEEAMKKMQELSMQMDDFLDKLDDASEQADQQADPELAEKFSRFQEDLEQTVKQQEALSEKTRALRDKYRDQQKDRIAREGNALKRELAQRLDELDKSWKQVDADHYGPRFQDARQQAQRSLENVKQALDANDFDLASDSADRLEDQARQMAEQADEQRRLDEMFQNPAEVRRQSKQMKDRLSRDARKAEEVAKSLRDLFPQPGQQLNEADRQQMQEMSRQQKGLQQKAQQLGQQMEEIGERAPIFNEDAQQQMNQAGQRMGNAQERLQGRDASRGFGEQQGALQALKGLQQSMQQQGQGKGKGGIPLPLKGARSSRGNMNEKVEIPDEDPNAAPREFRKDVMDAMKQGAPDRYRDQNKKYYEELVK
jgi:Domain of unknown function (DUF4175)